MVLFLRLIGWFGMFAGLLVTKPALAQSVINKPWGHTELDTVVSVRTPYRAQNLQDEGMRWLTAFFTKGSYHHFVMMRLDVSGMLQQQLETAPRKGHRSQPDSGAVTLNIEKCLRSMMKIPLLAFDKPKVSREYLVSLPAAPGGQASHRIYTGVDPDSHETALLEVRWFEVRGVVYFFFCTTVDPDGEDARQEKQRYFSTIQLNRS